MFPREMGANCPKAMARPVGKDSVQSWFGDSVLMAVPSLRVGYKTPMDLNPFAGLLDILKIWSLFHPHDPGPWSG